MKSNCLLKIPCYNVSGSSGILFVVDIPKHFPDIALCLAIILNATFQDCQRSSLLLMSWNTYETLHYALQLSLVLCLRIVGDSVCCWFSETFSRQCTMHRDHSCYNVSGLSEIVFVVDVLKQFRNNLLCFAIILNATFQDSQRSCLLLMLWNTYETLHYALQISLVLRFRIVGDQVSNWYSETLFRHYTLFCYDSKGINPDTLQ